MAKLGADDPRLRDEAWMRRTLTEHGEMWIALELGVNRKTVRRRMALLGIEAQPPGPRRGVAQDVARAATGIELDATEAKVIALRRRMRGRNVVRSDEETFADVLKAWYAAKVANDANAIDAAILDAAAALTVIHDHRQKLRRAA